MTDTRTTLLSVGLKAFDALGFERATVSAIRTAAGVSNGSFFHFFGSKEGLAASLFLDAIRAYHRAMLAPLAAPPAAADGVTALIHAHFDWVVANRREARFLFEQSRAEWLLHVRDEQKAENLSYRKGVERWREPLIEAGTLRAMPPLAFMSQVIGPAQMFCRAWLSGRETGDPRDHIDILIDCALRAVLTGAGEYEKKGPEK